MTYRTLFFFAWLLLAAIPASAVMLKPSSIRADQNSPVPSSAERPVMSAVQSGVITAIDVAQHTMVVEKTPYIFFAGLTKVRSVDPLVNGNPLKLKVGQSIDFSTVMEVDGKQRVTEVVVK